MILKFTKPKCSFYHSHVCLNYINTDRPMVIYISRGLLSSINEPSFVLETIAELNGKLNNRVIINTYAVIDG